MEGNRALARRALVATALTIGFYSLGVIVGVGAIVIPIVLTFALGLPTLYFIVIGLIGGGTVLWTMLPRRDRFDPPGPLLPPEKHPRFFAVLREIAGKTGQTMPKFVYLLHDFNAWVMQRGGSDVYGGDRMLGIGLPMLQQMSVSQLKAILAHEFGHYHNGDTAFGARIYRTRTAIGRTVEELEHRGSLLKAPFLWYGRRFMRITQAISRHQEFHADRLAAEIIGRDTVIATLHEQIRMASGYRGYLHNEYLPAVKYHMLPPWLDGFSRYLRSKNVREQIDDIAREALLQAESDKYDSHPSPAERLAALQRLPENDCLTDKTPAIELLEDREELERQIVRDLLGESRYAGMKPIRWEDDITAVDFRRWTDIIRLNRRYFREFTPADVPDFLNNPDKYVQRVLGSNTCPPEITFGLMNQLGAAIQAAYAALLVRHGFMVRREPGEEPLLETEELVLRPFSLLGELTSGPKAKEAWLEQCDRLGIASELLFVQDPIPAPDHTT